VRYQAVHCQHCRLFEVDCSAAQVVTRPAANC
jgi:hypothetical protein